MINCGLLGRRLSHSYSPQIHAHLGGYPYVLYEKEPEEIEDFLKHGCWTGINVTVPYKKDVIPHLDELTPIAKRLGAVNTIVRQGDKLIGHNTDYYGFLTMVRESGLDIKGKKALVLGSGGASRTAVAVLEELGANVIIISRQGINHYRNLHLHADAALLVNTTPVGMFPETGFSTVDLSQLPNLEGVLDLIYNPARTKLLLDAERRGLVTRNGLLMLVGQAKEAAEWFTDTRISDDVISVIRDQLHRKMENIVLVGMPGCGKTTIGRHLSQKICRPFVDVDEIITAETGKSIPDIFAEDGEEAFRELETKILSGLGKESGLIIGTGGGCVTKERNFPLLHQNGTIVWLKRDTALLPTEGRPLSRKGSLEEMYRLRAPLYEAFSDQAIDNNGSITETVAKIMEVLP